MGGRSDTALSAKLGYSGVDRRAVALHTQASITLTHYSEAPGGLLSSPPLRSFFLPCCKSSMRLLNPRVKRFSKEIKD
jgi:hypothetical protein